MFPHLFEIGGFRLPTYGVMVALGFLAALWITGRLARERGLDPEKLTNLGVYGALAGLAGAKVLMFFLEFRYYASNPGEIFTMATLQAGGVFFGGLIAALAFGAWYIRRLGLPLLPTLDLFAPGLAIGQALGRLGCFAAGCCWGGHCDRPWAVTFTSPEAAEITGVPLMTALHPTQLYEAALCFAIFLIAYRMTRTPRPAGQIIATYLILIAAARFVVEFFRHQNQAAFLPGPLSNAQWIALLLAALGIAVLRSKARTPVTAA